MDSALLGHPRVAEAVAFAAPDEKYGEIVAAAVVLTQPASGDADAITADIRKYAATKLANFKVTPHAPAVPEVPFVCIALRTCLCRCIMLSQALAMLLWRKRNRVSIYGLRWHSTHCVLQQPRTVCTPHSRQTLH